MRTASKRGTSWIASRLPSRATQTSLRKASCFGTRIPSCSLAASVADRHPLGRDFLPILTEPSIFGDLIDLLVSRVRRHPQVDTLVGLDARGFLLGPVIALQLKLRFAPVRKPGRSAPSVARSECLGPTRVQASCQAE